MRYRLAVSLVLLVAGCSATCYTAVLHYGGIDGESVDPSQVARITARDPRWLRPVSILGALAMVAGFAGFVMWRRSKP